MEQGLGVVRIDGERLPPGRFGRAGIGRVQRFAEQVQARDAGRSERQRGAAGPGRRCGVAERELDARTGEQEVDARRRVRERLRQVALRFGAAARGERELRLAQQIVGAPRDERRRADRAMAILVALAAAAGTAGIARRLSGRGDGAHPRRCSSKASKSRV